VDQGSESLAAQVVAAAIDRSFLADGVPTDAATFAARLAEGRPRFTLTAQEILRTVQAILDEHGALRRRLATVRDHGEAIADIDAQLKGLFPPGFIRDTPHAQLAHYPRYLKA